MTPAYLLYPHQGVVAALGPCGHPRLSPTLAPLTAPVLTVPETLGLRPSAETELDMDRALPPSH